MSSLTKRFFEWWRRRREATLAVISMDSVIDDILTSKKLASENVSVRLFQETDEEGRREVKKDLLESVERAFLGENPRRALASEMREVIILTIANELLLDEFHGNRKELYAIFGKESVWTDEYISSQFLNSEVRTIAFRHFQATWFKDAAKEDCWMDLGEATRDYYRSVYSYAIQTDEDTDAKEISGQLLLLHKEAFERAKKKASFYGMDRDLVAMVPIGLLLMNRPPFDSWKSDDIEVPSEHVGFIKQAVWAYQVKIYLALITRSFGADVAESLEEIQVERLNNVPEKLGDTLSGLLKLITLGAETEDELLKVDLQDGEEVTLPIEIPIAWGILALHPSSPHFVPPEKRQDGDMQNPLIEDGLDKVMALCLAQGKDEAMRVFGPVVEGLEAGGKLESAAGISSAAD